MIIALGYRARVGKDTAASYLVRKHGFVPLSFAAALKSVCSILAGEDMTTDEAKAESTVFGITGGQLLQRTGTALKEAIDPRVWVVASGLRAKAMLHKRLVITDLRFCGEAQEVRALGGFLWEIVRPGVAIDTAEAEGAQIRWDCRLSNSGTIAEFEAVIDQTLASCMLCAAARNSATPQAPSCA